MAPLSTELHTVPIIYAAIDNVISSQETMRLGPHGFTEGYMVVDGEHT